jgi:hypothetical protein
MRRALLRADRLLSKYDPLPRLFYVDDFNEGLQGWTSLMGNYEEDLDRMHPGYRQLTGPMISNLGFWDCGSHGGLSGSYAMKMTTRPNVGALNVALKRSTFVKACPIQVEFWFVFKPEASARQLLETDMRSIGVVLDLQNDDWRIMPHLRYLNSHDGQRVEKWQFKQTEVPFHRFSEKTVTHYHLADQDWEDISGERQILCYNEIPTKVNWQYCKLGFDLRTMKYTHFQCNDIVYDMSDKKTLEIKAMPNLRGMLNVLFFCESDADRRASFYVDSVCVSGDWD